MKLNNKGITLIELLIVMALMGVIGAVAFSMYLFGNNTYLKVDKQYQLQSDLRLSTDYIIKEVRNASELEIVEVPISTFVQGYHYIYIENKKLIYYYNENSVAKTESVLQNDLFNPAFKRLKLSNNKNMLSIVFIGAKISQNYKVDTEVLLNNINGLDFQQGNAIKYKKNYN